MVKAVSRGQALEVSSRFLSQVRWDEVDEGKLQREVISLSPAEFGRRFTAFLNNGAQLNLGPNMLRIDRSKPFDPATFIGNGWTIHPDEPEDERSLALTEIDLSKIHLVTMLKPSETSIVGEEKLKRLKRAKHIRLDAKILQALWENQDRIPEEWKGKYTYFDGTVLRSPGGGRYVLYLCFREGGWRWSGRWLVLGWGSGDPSAVLASI